MNAQQIERAKEAAMINKLYAVIDGQLDEAVVTKETALYYFLAGRRRSWPGSMSDRILKSHVDLAPGTEGFRYVAVAASTMKLAWEIELAKATKSRENLQRLVLESVERLQVAQTQVDIQRAAELVCDRCGAEQDATVARVTDAIMGHWMGHKLCGVCRAFRRSLVPSYDQEAK